MELTELKQLFATTQDNIPMNTLWCTDVKLSSLGQKANVIIYKMSRMVVTKGKKLDDYSLPWGEWMPGMKGYFITHKGNSYARFYPVDGNISQVEFVVLQKKDGKVREYKLTKEKLLETGWISPNTLQSKGKPECFTVNVDNVLSVEKRGEE